MEAVDKFGNLAYGMVLAQLWLYFDFICFYLNFDCSKAGYNDPLQKGYPTFMDNKGQTWGQVL